MNRLQFNTGRKYTAQGQRIVAVLHEDGVVSFNDHARMIWGEYKSHHPNPIEAFTREIVLMMYDAGKYHMSSRVQRGTHDWIE